MRSSWNAASFVTGDAPYSSSSNYQSQPKRPRHGSDISSSNFNGHWGAPIYQNQQQQQQLWLGMEAAVGFVLLPTYSSGIMNFPWTSVTPQEQKFPTQRFNVDHDLGTGPGKKVNQYQLFEKILSASDVGKPNRLLIPKKSAVKYFPLTPEGEKERVADSELTFFDESMKQWKFRYSFWKSNRIYVFTRGWNSFVKEKGLRAKDRVVFFQCEFCDGGTQMSTFFRISVKYFNNIVKAAPHQHESVAQEKKSFRLFGVEIFGDCKEEDRE